jgi:Spy/CpxP family protein refolding chaperone
MVIFLALATAAPIWAQTADNSWWGFGPGAMNPLGLTAEQMTQIQNLTNKWLQEMQPIWNDLQKKNLELDQLMWSVDPDSAAVEAKSKEIGNLQAEIRKKSVERQKAVRELLTEEQKTAFDQYGLGAGWGIGPCGLGLGRGMGRGGGFGRGRGRGGWGGRFNGAPGIGWGLTGSPGSAWGFYGRGPCGMGYGRSSMGNWGRRRW